MYISAHCYVLIITILCRKLLKTRTTITAINTEFYTNKDLCIELLEYSTILQALT